jgi:hypothetical protein
MSAQLANAADPGPHMALVATDICGCTGWVSVLGYGHDDEAYREAARELKAGMRIEHVEVEAWKAAKRWHCVDHPDGPPWWKSRGGKVKRPTQWPAPEQTPLVLP